MNPFKKTKNIYLITLLSSLSMSYAVAYYPGMPMNNQNDMKRNYNAQFGLNYGVGLGGNMSSNNNISIPKVKKNKAIEDKNPSSLFTNHLENKDTALALESTDTVNETTSTTNKSVTSKTKPEIKRETTPPYDSLVQEDQQLKGMIDQNSWFLRSHFTHLKTAQHLAFKRGYLNSLMSMATNYNVWYSPRQEYLEVETDPLVTEAMLVLEYTDSSILTYVAETLLQTMKSSKLLSVVMSDKFAFEDDRIKNSSWYNKSQSDVKSGFQKAWDEYTSSITQLEQNKVADDQKLEKATKNLYHRRTIESLIKYNSKIDNAFLTTLKTDLETKIATSIASKDTEATEGLLDLYSMVITNLRPVIAGSSPTEATDPKVLFESAKTYITTTLPQLQAAYPRTDYPKMESVVGTAQFVLNFAATMLDPKATLDTQVPLRGKAKASYIDLLNINILNSKSKISMKDDQSITASQVQFTRAIPLPDKMQKKIDATKNKAKNLKSQGVTKETTQVAVQAKIDAAKATLNDKAATVPSISNTNTATSTSATTAAS